MAVLSSEEDWHCSYDEKILYSREEIASVLKEFLEYAGYRIVPSSVIGFMRPEIAAERTANSNHYQMIFVVRQGINQAVEGLRQLAAAKCFKKDTMDYVLALPPVSEHYLIEFLIEREEWFFPIKEGLFQLWLVNPEKKKVDCVMGWPRDELFVHYFSNPRLAGFATYIANKAAGKIIEEEFS